MSIKFNVAIAVALLASSASGQTYTESIAIDPVYNGNCRNDGAQLGQHFEYWNSGRHGSDPEECKYAVDELIRHQEMAYYANWPQRCRENGMTIMPMSGSNYTGMLYEIKSDAELAKTLNRAVSALRRVVCTPNARQQRELDRQAARAAAPVGPVAAVSPPPPPKPSAATLAAEAADQNRLDEERARKEAQANLERQEAGERQRAEEELGRARKLAEQRRKAEFFEEEQRIACTIAVAAGTYPCGCGRFVPQIKAKVCSQ